MPCHSRSVIRTAYVAAGLRHLLRAAERLGWKIVHAEASGTSVTVETKDGGVITATPGRCDITYASEADAGRLMQEYARSTFEEMVDANPDTYEQVDMGPAQAVFNIRGRK